MSTADVYALIAGPNDSQAQTHGPLFYVPVEQRTPVGLGPPNEQQFQSGFTNNVKQNPAAEQGIGRSPGQRWPHYPLTILTNPARRTQVQQRDGRDNFPNVYRAEQSAIFVAAVWQNQRSPKFTNAVKTTAVVNQPPVFPFTLGLPEYSR